MKKNKEMISKLYAFITVIIWSTVFLSTRQLLQHYSAMEVGFMRYFVASIALLVIMVVRKEELPKKEDISLFVGGGLFGFSVYIIAFNTAADMLPSGMCSFIVTTSPIFTVLFAKIFLNEQMEIGGKVSLVIQMIGIGILTLKKGENIDSEGVLIMLGAAISLAVYNLIQRKLVQKGYRPIQITSYCICIGTLCMSFSIPGIVEKSSYFTLKDLGAVLYLGVVASSIAYYFWAKAMSLTIKTSSVSNFMFLIPFLTSIIGAIVFDEIPGVEMYVGGSVLTIGFLIYILSENKKTRRER